MCFYVISMYATSPNYDERLYVWAAVASQSIEPCKKIGISSIETWAFNPYGFQAESLRSQCFRSVAIKTGDKKLCKYAVPVSRLRSWWFDGSGFSTDHCLEKIVKKQFVLNTLIPDQRSRLMSSLQYTNESIYDECEEQFSTQREATDNIVNKFYEQYDICVARKMRASGGLERKRSIFNSADKHEEFCYQRTLMHSGVKDHYLGGGSNKYPNNRRYGYCEHFCSINEFKGYCEKKDDNIPEGIYIEFLESQAHSGDLLQRLQLMPDY